MNEKEALKKLIDSPKQPNVSEWVYEVETFLEEINESNEEAWMLIDGIKKQGDVFQRCENLVALLRQLYKKKYDKVFIPPITKRNQIFVAMMFSGETVSTYEQVYKPVIQMLNYSAMRIDEKQFNGSIIGEITTEITDSVALIADLTGNRGGVYYEAGIARGLQLCNHPIKLILTCKRSFFDNERVHFDVSGDNIVLYENDDDLRKKLTQRLQAVLNEETKA
ncbi:hypothetical protein [Waltera sp.]|jgi:hypothetical protein|uniref:hypothetical protein n=1 Tax=Waltera sp. TaxID=2815806 RepID=UPI003AF0CC0B|nr:hypothetical protein [Clostridium sp.]